METSLPQTITELPNLPIPIISVSRAGVISAVNPQAIRDFGGIEQDLVGHTVDDILTDKKTPEALHALFFGTVKAARKFEKKQTDNIQFPEIRIRTKDKGDRIVQIKPRFIVEGDMKSGFEIVVNDITQQKQAEALRRTSELLSSNLSLEEILKTLPEILREVVPHDSANIMLLNDDRTPSTNISWAYNSEGDPVQRTPTFNNIDTKSILQTIINTKKPVIIDETETHTEWEKTDNPDDHPVRSYLGVPILSEGKVIGFLNFNSFKPNTFSSTDISLLQEFSDQLTQAMANASKVGEISRLAITDGLTGLHNRRRLDELFLAEITRALRFEEPLSTVIADIDDFKSVNDTYGHSAGDEVLKELARRFRAGLRDTDIVGRYGGEEFEWILPNTNRHGTHILAEKLRTLIEENPFRVSKNNRENKTLSIGVASLPTASPLYQDPKNVDHGAIREDMRSHADEALYVVKKLAGKNGIGVFIPGRTDESGKDVFTDDFDQVVVIKPKKKPYNKIQTNVATIQTQADEDYWEVQVYKRVISPVIDAQKSTSGPVTYEPLVTYNIYKELSQNTQHIFRVDPQTLAESAYPTASLQYDQRSYLFDEGHEHHQAVINRNTSADSFGWVKILFPPHTVPQK